MSLLLPDFVLEWCKGDSSVLRATSSGACVLCVLMRHLMGSAGCGAAWLQSQSVDRPVSVPDAHVRLFHRHLHSSEIVHGRSPLPMTEPILSVSGKSCRHYLIHFPIILAWGRLTAPEAALGSLQSRLAALILIPMLAYGLAW